MLILLGFHILPAGIVTGLSTSDFKVLFIVGRTSIMLGIAYCKMYAS